MKKLNKKAGFTLAELLIVVAIIAILVAIGIPAFSTAMERSRETVDLSNIRGAYAEFMAGTMGGSANTGYYKVNIKQRDCTKWIIDTNGFLSNIVEYDTTNKKYVMPDEMPHTNLATGDIWVKFTTKGGSTTTPAADPSATPSVSPNGDSEKPMLSFVTFDKAAYPTGVTDDATTGTLVERESTDKATCSWYLSKE